jgi:hypothetical protein
VTCPFLAKEKVDEEWANAAKKAMRKKGAGVRKAKKKKKR